MVNSLFSLRNSNLALIALVLSGSLAIADSFDGPIAQEDPNMKQFTKQNTPTSNQDQFTTEGQICIQCLEQEFRQKFSEQGKITIDIKKVLKEIDQEKKQKAIFRANSPSTSNSEESVPMIININTEDFTKETASMLAEKIRAQNLTAGSTVAIVLRKDIANQKQKILKAIQSSFEQEEPKSNEGKSNNNRVLSDLPNQISKFQISGSKLKFKIFSSQDEIESSNTSIVSDNGKARLEASLHRKIDKRTYMNVSATAIPGRSAITLEYQQKF